MTMKVKIVVVMHPNNKNTYAFKVPEKMNLDAGDYVLCDTVRSHEEIARCITPSFFMRDDLIQQYYNINVDNMKSIVAILKPVMYAPWSGKDGDEF